MPTAEHAFPDGDLEAYRKSYDAVRCVVMQGGQGEVKHWAFNDPPQARRQMEGRAAAAGRILASSRRASPICIR